MNSLPPFAANTNESDHPALESIAAYLDGRLPDPERRAMTAHLDSCAACYEIYSESLRFQKEESVDARRGVLTFEPRKNWIPPNLLRNLALPLAALLLVGVGAAVWYQLHRPLEAQSVDGLWASLGNPESLTERLGPFDTDRGYPEPSVNYPVVAFQSGATLVDLRVAIEANDPEKIDLFAHTLRVLYNHGADFSEAKERKEVEVAVDRLLKNEASSNLLEVRLTDLRSIEMILRSTYADPLAPHFELGAWTEAGRLAAYGERAAFFADPKNRRSLRWFRRNPPKEEVKSALAEIENGWPDTGANPANLGPKFDGVIDPYNVSPTEE